MIRPPMRTLLATALLTTTIAAQSITWLEGPAPGQLALRAVPENAPDAAPVTLLSNLTALPIEITARTRQQELDASRSRRIDRDGLVRVELPGGGRLIAYRRGATDYGFVHIGPSGDATVVLEAGGAFANPFVDRIAVAADGRFALVADAVLPQVSLVRLDGNVFASTNRPWRTIPTSSPVEEQAALVGSTHAFFATDDERLWRCALADGSTPQEITPPSIPGARLKSELAISGDGHFVACLYGVQPSFGIYLAHDTLATRRLPVPDAKYEEPGYLPEFVGGPRLLLDATGSRLLYVDATIRDEAYLMDTTGAAATVHVTGDANFQPYIGAVILPVFAQSVLLVAVGDPDRFDVYAAAAGVASVVNLTQTNGNTRAPFASGELIPENVALTAGGQLLVAEHVGTAPSRLRRIDFATGTSTVIADGFSALPAGASAPMSLTPDLVLHGASGDLLVGMTAGTPRLRAPAGVDLASAVHLARWSRVVTARVGSVSALVFHTDGGGLLALPAVNQAQRAILTPGGNLLIDSSALLHVSARLGVRTVQTTGALRFVLSGVGA